MLDVLFEPSLRYLRGWGRIEPRVLNRSLERFLVQVAGDRAPLNTCVGRVGLKVEPAGKSRLFMIMDSISQRSGYYSPSMSGHSAY